MKKLLCALVMIGFLCATALAAEMPSDNSMYYGSWEVKGKVGNAAYEQFTWKIGEQAYSPDAANQWAGFTGLSWYPFEYVPTSETTGYYYTQLPRTGDFFHNETYFFEDGRISGNPGWRDKAALFVHLNGQQVSMDFYATDPTNTNMYKTANVALDFDPSYTNASISGTFYDFTGVRDWRKPIEGGMNKIWP